MKKLFLLVVCTLTAGAVINVSAQEIVVNNGRTKTVRASGKTVTENYEPGGFYGVKCGSGINVEIEHGSSYGVKVRTDKNVLDYLSITVRSGVLSIGYRNNINVRNIKTTVYVTMPDIESLDASSGSSIRLMDNFAGARLTADASSAGSITGSIEYENVKASASSGGSVKLSGRADSCSASASSGGSVNMSSTHSNKAEVYASSGGSVSAYATESLTGKASSGGYIRYAGDPRNIDIRTSGGGAVGAIKKM